MWTHIMDIHLYSHCCKIIHLIIIFIHIQNPVMFSSSFRYIRDGDICTEQSCIQVRPRISSFTSKHQTASRTRCRNDYRRQGHARAPGLQRPWISGMVFSTVVGSTDGSCRLREENGLDSLSASAHSMQENICGASPLRIELIVRKFESDAPGSGGGPVLRAGGWAFIVTLIASTESFSIWVSSFHPSLATIFGQFPEKSKAVINGRAASAPSVEEHVCF